MILLIDNYDSFSYNLYQLVGEFEPNIWIIRNDEMTAEEIRALQPERIILSPGPGRPEDAGITMEVVTALGHEIPILGVCLGHQAICAAFGASITYAKALMHGKQSQVRFDPDCPLFRGCPETAPCGAVPLPGGGRPNPSGVPEDHRSNRGRRGHGGAAQGASGLRCTVPPRVHFDARRENHAPKLHKGDVNHDQRSYRQDRQ